VDLFSFNSYIRGQILPIGSDTVGSSLLFNDIYYDANRWSPDVNFIDDSTFVVVWFGEGPETPGPNMGVYGQVATILNPATSDSLLSDHGFSNTRFGETRVLSIPSTGNFVAIWWDDNGGNKNIYGRLFYKDGLPKDSSFLITENPELTDLFYLSAAIDANGDFGVVWGTEIDSLWQIRLRWFGNDGTALGPSESITSTLDTIPSVPSVDIAIDRDGKSVVVWEQMEKGLIKIYARRFLPDKNPLGNSFGVSTRADTTNQYAPRIVLMNEKMYTTWAEPGNGIWANIIDFNKPPVAIEEGQRNEPRTFYLYQNYPNPFNPQTTIPFKIIGSSASVQLLIFDIIGRIVRNLFEGALPPGKYDYVWNGKNDLGKDVSSGIYFYSLKAGNQLFVKKMMLLR